MPVQPGFVGLLASEQENLVNEAMRAGGVVLPLPTNQ